MLIVGGFNSSISLMDMSTKQKLNREIRNLTHAMTQRDIADFYRLFYPKTKA